MLKWYLISPPSEEAGRNVLKSLREQRLMVRRRNGKLCACIGNQHQTWLSHVCQDFGAQLKVLAQAPEGIKAPTKEEYLTPCGERFYDPILYSHHFRTCEKCKVGGTKVIAKLEPGLDLSLDGVIASLEVTRDQLWEKVEGLDSLLTNLKGYRDSKETLAELNTEVTKRIDAVRLLLKDNKL